ncbi:MAG: hypothetical protein M1368_10700, partial [Thaumarchaeota archaeon]|nr:hypothetical protein [Nitrososphaerota archaeon]
DRLNDTLGELFEERLLRIGILRNWWSDGYRILIELNTEEIDTDEMTATMLQFDENIRGYLNAVVTKHFPFGYEMKFVAERFGAMKRGRMLSGEALKELGIKFRFTPIYEETMREAMVSKIDIDGSLDFLNDCLTGKVQVVTRDLNRPSPLGARIIKRYLESDDYEDAPLESVNSMKISVSKETASLLCFDCGDLRESVTIGGLDEQPTCEKCGSKLISVLFYGSQFARSSWLKKRSKQILTVEESEALSRARRSADIVLAYGKKGAIALSIYGIGPQSAVRVLSKMHESEEEFYQDLLKAKLKFIDTRRYWD